MYHLMNDIRVILTRPEPSDMKIEISLERRLIEIEQEIMIYCADEENESHAISYAEGYDEGSDEGYDEGRAQGYAEGCDKGYDEGYGEGYDEGYEAGMLEAAEGHEDD